MRLIDLEPRFQKHSIEPAGKYHGRRCLTARSSGAASR
jgi:hypothetical protein